MDIKSIIAAANRAQQVEDANIGGAIELGRWDFF